MSRWQPGAAERLQNAALELFTEQGFTATTVPQITARAGLATRTFFRHYADKREVLFAGEDELPDVVARVFAAAAPDLTPVEVIEIGLTTVVAPRLDGRHAYFRTRRDVINSDSGLRERELHKLALLVDAGTIGFRHRGLCALQSAIAAQLAVTVFDVALHRWLDGSSSRPFAPCLTQTAEALRNLTTASSSVDPAHRPPSA